MVSIVSISDKGKKSARSFKMPTVLLANSQAGEKGEKKDRGLHPKIRGFIEFPNNHLKLSQCSSFWHGSVAFSCWLAGEVSI